MTDGMLAALEAELAEETVLAEGVAGDGMTEIMERGLDGRTDPADEIALAGESIELVELETTREATEQEATDDREPDEAGPPQGQIAGETQAASVVNDAGLHVPTDTHEGPDPHTTLTSPHVEADATLPTSATSRRSRRRQAAEAESERAVPWQPTSESVSVVADIEIDAEPDDVDDNSLPTAEPGATASGDDLDDPAWREHWPDNDVCIVAQLLPRASEAPVLDGVHRTRMELSLVENHGGEFGAMGNLPIFVMPGAPGFEPIYGEIVRARRRKERLQPILVEVKGILRQMPDRDGRYATERYTVRMGVEVHRIARVADDTEHYARWRGRATVCDARTYTLKGMPHQRVTAMVTLRQRTARLRGVSLIHIPVDFLVSPDHEHLDRFQHLGQRLLIEATIGGDVRHMGENHPALEGLDPHQKAQLQVLRDAVVTVTMGEFPDETAEREYERWVAAGRPWVPLQTRLVQRRAFAESSGSVVPQSPNEVRPQRQPSTRMERPHDREEKPSRRTGDISR